MRHRSVCMGRTTSPCCNCNCNPNMLRSVRYFSRNVGQFKSQSNGSISFDNVTANDDSNVAFVCVCMCVCVSCTK